MKSQYDQSRVLWTKEALAFLARHYPGGMAMHAICKATRHHSHEVHNRAAMLGLVRRKAVPLKVSLGMTTHISSTRFVAATFEDVIGWLRKHGHKVDKGLKDGLWKVGCFDAQTPQMVIRFANDRRCRHYGLPPFQVDTGGRMPSEISGTRLYSLTGSSMDMQLVGLGSK